MVPNKQELCQTNEQESLISGFRRDVDEINVNYHTTPCNNPEDHSFQTRILTR